MDVKRLYLMDCNRSLNISMEVSMPPAAWLALLTQVQMGEDGTLDVLQTQLERALGYAEEKT